MFQGLIKMFSDKKQIYIVDDDESVCRALKCLLLTFGFDVSIFLSAEKYFGATPNSSEGCLVMDIHMPGIDGLEALRRIVEAGSKRPVIIISADKNGGLQEQVIKLGASGFFQKPVNAQELVDLINKVY